MPDTENTIAGRLDGLRASLPDGVRLVAVSKFHPVEAVAEAYGAGQRAFGESRVAELLEKEAALPADIDWHFIGHLQTNKVKSLVGHVAVIESVDSRRLLDLIDTVSEQKGVVTRVLMEVHVAAEESKFGWKPEELLDYFRERQFESLRATHICGIMGMATNTDDAGRIEADFESLASLFRRIREVAPDLRGFDILSMGMSDDYPIAIRHGATHVRIGSKIFGERNY